MKTIGDPDWRSKSGHHGELRVVVDGSCCLLVTGQALDVFSLKTDVRGVPFLSCDLVNEEKTASFFPFIRRGSLLEFWVASPDAPLSLLATLRVDFVRYVRKAGSERLHVEGRSPAAALFDTACTGAFMGTLSDLIRSICPSQYLAPTLSLSDASLDAWINADSAYGALRLIGASLDLVVSAERDGTLRVAAREQALRNAMAKTPLVIDADQILSEDLQEGVPVRLPQDE